MAETEVEIVEKAADQGHEEVAFRLSDLPAELQLRIIDHAVTTDEPIYITYRTWTADNDYNPAASRTWELWSSKESVLARMQPVIARVSRDIREDAIKLYYGSNTFVAGYCDSDGPELSHTQVWLKAIGETNRLMICRLLVFDPFLEDYEDLSQEDEEALENSCLLKFKQWIGGIHGRLAGKVVSRSCPTYRVVFQKANTAPEEEGI